MLHIKKWQLFNTFLHENQKYDSRLIVAQPCFINEFTISSAFKSKSLVFDPSKITSKYLTFEIGIRIFRIPYGRFLLVWGDWTGALLAGVGIPHEGTNSVALTFKFDIGALRSSSPWSQLSGAPPDDILESNKMLKNQTKIFQFD